ncbi:BACON domain-containing protein [Streptomyces sp. ME19-01-6]|uniref:BACON domain-containing protein n=1 Tax=Streptomyces sp. ME19-01-6 TaxID=3028686 RepID=UPI0029B7EDA3|nr:sigma-70 family RNA polymerase sigma factor [Streptomyces sp. ME19-01-6]MDX3228207.1 sigma-70 family RNA polymerase sigma factor [Streptomyces sp. ME19-01-6]
MSSRSEHSTHSPGAPGASGASSASGAPGAPRRAPRASAAHLQRPPARYEPYLDGLFTYCLSVLCEHDAATAALGEALAVAERQHGRGRGRVAAEGDLRRPWLYALARWACLRKLAERKGLEEREGLGGEEDSGGQGAPGERRAPGDRGIPGDRRGLEDWRVPGDRGASGDRGAPEGRRERRAATGRGGIEKRVGRPRPPEVPAQRRHRDRRAPAAAASPPPPPVSPTAAQRRRELAALAWPEAAGTTPEQREALELAVRHRLSPSEVAAALGKERDETRALLASAACEVERTRAALAVVELGHCPVVARLAGDTQVLLSAALRRELVRHVDDCRECRGMAERATAGGPWPGTAAAPAALPVLEAPRAAVYAAMVGAQGARPARAASRPRFDRRGFPLDPKDQAARRGRMRSRALTTTVVASVVAAPLLALWAAYRGTPTAGDDHDTDSVAAANADGAAERTPDRSGGGVRDESPRRSYDEAGSAQNRSGARLKSGRGGTAGKQSPDVSVEVVGGDETGAARGDRGGDGEAERSGTATGGRPGPHATSGTHGTHGTPGAGGRPGTGSGPGRTEPGPGRLTVEAQPSGEVTVITLRASGGGPVHWSASAGAPWLQLSHTAGVLRPGETTTITVSVDRDREPPGRWSARVRVDPAGAVVVIEGRGAEPEPTPGPSDPPGESTPTSGETP